MFIQPLPSGPLATNCYVVACPATREAAIIDPAPESTKAVVACVSKHQLIPKKILLTHSHWDHIADVAKLKELYKIPVYIHEEDAPNLESPGADRLPSWIDIPGVQADAFFKENDMISVGDLLFQVIETPGHTPGGVCFYCPEKKTLISGDTLFKGSMGNVSFPLSKPKLMWDSLKKLSKLPPETLVYPGHGPSTTIGNESWLSRAEELFG